MPVSTPPNLRAARRARACAGSPHYIAAAQAVIDGSWQPQDFWGGMSEGVVVIRKLSEAIPPSSGLRTPWVPGSRPGMTVSVP